MEHQIAVMAEPYLQQIFHEMAAIMIRAQDRGGYATMEDLAELAHLPAKYAETNNLPPELAGKIEQIEGSVRDLLRDSARHDGSLMVDGNPGNTT